MAKPYYAVIARDYKEMFEIVEKYIFTKADNIAWFTERSLINKESLRDQNIKTFNNIRVIDKDTKPNTYIPWYPEKADRDGV